jgi:hypothetical protein
MAIPAPISNSIWVAQASIPSYTGLLNRATASAQLFSTFKQNPNFLGPVGFTSGDYAMLSISQSNAISAALLPVSQARNDVYGTPYAINLSGSRKIGWDTCRFFGTIGYIIENFTSDMTGKSVYEWGSNYGGLMTCMLETWPNMATYYCNDLPEVVNFSNYYIAQLEASGGLSFTTTIWNDPTGSNAPTASIDLFVSEYAMTEMDTGSMYTIYNNYGKNANGVFIRTNLLNFGQFQQFLDTVQQDFTW